MTMTRAGFILLSIVYHLKSVLSDEICKKETCQVVMPPLQTILAAFQADNVTD